MFMTERSGHCAQGLSLEPGRNAWIPSTYLFVSSPATAEEFFSKKAV